MANFEINQKAINIQAEKIKEISQLNKETTKFIGDILVSLNTLLAACGQQVNEPKKEIKITEEQQKLKAEKEKLEAKKIVAKDNVRKEERMPYGRVIPDTRSPGLFAPKTFRRKKLDDNSK